MPDAIATRLSRALNQAMIITVQGSELVPDLTPLQQLGNQLVLFLPTLISAVVLFIIFWIASRVVGRVLTGAGNRAKLDSVVRKLLVDSVRITILTVGAITAFGTVGIDVSALIAGLGLTSLALGLALQDVVRNAVSGMLILMYRPFRLGDSIDVTGSVGEVIDINLRYTVLRGDNKTLLIPNQNVFSNVVVVNRPPEDRQIAK